MAVLSKISIEKLVKDGELQFNPGLDSFQLNSHSIDLRLGYTFMIPGAWKLTANGREALSLSLNDQDDDMKSSMEVIELEEGQYFDLLPKEFIIATALEKITMPDSLMATLFPRSSQNRRGLSVNLTGLIDAGYSGNLIIPIENKNMTPIRLYPGERFCQLAFEWLDEAVTPEKSRYHKQDVTVGMLTERHDDEVKMIRSGQVQDLKKKYAI